MKNCYVRKPFYLLSDVLVSERVGVVQHLLQLSTKLKLPDSELVPKILDAYHIPDDADHSLLLASLLSGRKYSDLSENSSLPPISPTGSNLVKTLISCPIPTIKRILDSFLAKPLYPITSSTLSSRTYESFLTSQNVPLHYKQRFITLHVPNVGEYLNSRHAVFCVEKMIDVAPKPQRECLLDVIAKEGRATVGSNVIWKKWNVALFARDKRKWREQMKRIESALVGANEKKEESKKPESKEKEVKVQKKEIKRPAVVIEDEIDELFVGIEEEDQDKKRHKKG